MEDGNTNLNGNLTCLVPDTVCIKRSLSVTSCRSIDGVLASEREQTGNSLTLDLENMVTRRHSSEGGTHNSSQTLDGNSLKSIVTTSTSVYISDNDSPVDERGCTLMYSRHETVPMKNFSLEARAAMDMASYLKNTVLLLDVSKTSMDDITEACLSRMLESVNNKHIYEQARSALFTHDCVHQLSHTVQSTSITDDDGFEYDQSWICVMCTIPSLPARQVCIVRFLNPANLGQTCQEVHFLVVILVPTKEKETKNELQIARTFGTIFSNAEFRQELLEASSEKAFKELLHQFTHKLIERHSISEVNLGKGMDKDKQQRIQFRFLKGISGDLRRRIPHYISDYTDGISDRKSVSKTISCTCFLYFACIMPCIAFGVLNSFNTGGMLTVEKAVCSQAFGGIIFAVFGGTPHIVLLATAPLALYTQIIFTLSRQFGLDFQAFFAWTGLFNCMFLIIFSVFDVSLLMRFSTRSTEEIFAFFVSIAFSVDVYRNFAQNFNHFYCHVPGLSTHNFSSGADIIQSANGTAGIVQSCSREVSLLYLLLLLATLCLGVALFAFRNTPYLTAGKRDLLADYSIPLTVIVNAFIGAFLFRDVQIGKSFEPLNFYSDNFFKWVDLSLISWRAIAGSCGLGFCLSLLFFTDQNISAAVVNASQNKLKKGTAYHWDLFVIAAINVILSMLCFPMVHAVLMHSTLHVAALADVEERVIRGHVQRIIVKVRETRLTCIFSHVLIGLSLLIMSVLAYIPTPVLYGMFLCIAVKALVRNQMFERILLIITEQTAYPPNHYIRKVPQRKIHIFTCLQVLQLAVLVGFGFTPVPYLKMFFPVVIFLLIPVRHLLIPKVIEEKFLKALDGH